eukprot:TRINITY_DN85899_c0_g1_i1.p1 TRINITY_DN85899_c0_g1~~TRINITY_DN85899_c0_g1_i1.p1  ORF type:complete len:155 (-),score=37.56 TRINITY_DN85899_c0_g1_i1:122-586(-)
MSLLIEPLNKATCLRNEKERLLMQGKLKKKSQQDYLMEHMGLTKAQLDKAEAKARRREQSKGASSALKSASALLTEGALASHTDAMSNSMSRSQSLGAIAAAKQKRPASRGSVTASEVSEARPAVPQDPVLAVLMNGPPLFSPGLCSRACQALM